MLQNLTYELGVLAKAVQHKNLSAAAVHVGLSQPQLSRLIAKIENELNIVLLDRTARRKSGWTPLAQELSMTFAKGMGRLQGEIAALAEKREVNELRVGSLEGLASLAVQFTQSCFQELDIKLVSLDLIFTVRSPSKQKFNKVLEVGFQQIERINTGNSTLVCSPFEYTGMDKNEIAKAEHVFICNSLSVRTDWLHNLGGFGNLPVDAKKGRGKGHYSIDLIGSDLLSPRLWKQITGLFA